jgi:hypothetical protein
VAAVWRGGGVARRRSGGAAERRGGGVDLAEPMIVRAGEALIAVPVKTR